MNKINVLISGSNRGLGKSLAKIFNKNNKYNIIKCSRKKIKGYEILRLENDIVIKKDIIKIIKKLIFWLITPVLIQKIISLTIT